MIHQKLSFGDQRARWPPHDAKTFHTICFDTTLCLPMASCSVRKFAINKIGDAIASGGSTYESDEDIELITQALPFSLKLAVAYGIDPLHLGVVFLANMELGYLMPPMGENLFLASYRFDQPLAKIYSSTLSYIAILVSAVLLITYVPDLTLGLVRFMAH